MVHVSSQGIKVMGATNQKVDAFLGSAEEWRGEMERLRSIALDCGLNEELKWRLPCYTYEQSNVAIIQNFKEKCALMFFKGALLTDAEGLLEKPGKNSRVGRRLVFSSVDEVDEMEDRIRDFIAQAIEIEKAELDVELDRTPEPVPRELKEMFKETPGLKKAFEALTPGRQRGYILHFSGAKQSKTRRSRTEKCVPRILDGKGLRD